MNTLLALTSHSARYRSHGSGYGDYLLFHWLWLKFRWWSIAIYAGVMAGIGGLKAMFGIGSDD